MFIATLLFKENRPDRPSTLEEFKLSIEESGNTWFGCLLDRRDRLVASAFGSSSRALKLHLSNYSRRIGGAPLPSEHRLTHEMIDLFEGKNALKPVSFNTEHVSKFQLEVYKVLERIPMGKVTTYGLISKHLGSAARAVGGAVSSNPWPLFIPCQRVVNFDLTIGNYGLCGTLGPAGTIAKRTLLERESVPILDDRVQRTALWDPSRNTH
jgi:O-6-methylguanine DNA methyltransferase